MKLSNLKQHPTPLAEHYQHFNVANRLLFTGHSHQAWPDCGLEGQIQAWHDAANYVDSKWDKAEEKAEQVRQGFAKILSDKNGDYALGQNTFDLVLRFITALPLRQKPKIVTTDKEFHSLRRLLARLSEESIEIVKVSVEPMTTLLERLIAATDSSTAAVCCSKVFYNTGLISENLQPLANHCQENDVELLVDAYHAINVIPFSIESEGLEQAYIVGGGYKYCQLGEGNCFIRLPKDCTLRPIASGWYGEFATVHKPVSDLVQYADGPARFAGATYDPTSHYRAAEVFNFFAQQQLTPKNLRQISQHQIALLQSTFLGLDLDPKTILLDTNTPLQARAGFITFNSSQADILCAQLNKSGVHCDNRGQVLRFGPAPYLSDQQCQDAITALGDEVKAI